MPTTFAALDTGDLTKILHSFIEGGSVLPAESSLLLGFLKSSLKEQISFHQIQLLTCSYYVMSILDVRPTEDPKTRF